MVFRFGDGFVMAADGKQRNLHGEILRTCKIRTYPAFTFMAAGLTESPFHSVRDLIERIGELPLQVSIDERIKRFEQSMLIELPKAVQLFHQRQMKPGSGRAVIDPFKDGSVLTALFLGVENSLVKLWIRRFSVSGGKESTEVVISESATYPDASGRLPTFSMYGSATPAVMPFLSAHTVSGPPADPVVFLQRLLEEGLRIAPDDVGRPFHMIFVAAKATKWIKGFEPDEADVSRRFSELQPVTSSPPKGGIGGFFSRLFR
jgi:hypothetical protein